MNTKEQAVKKLVEFFKSNDQFLFIDGTHQYEKHPLVIQAAAAIFKPQPFRMLFRSNAAANTGQMLSKLGINTLPKPGALVNVAGKFNLCVDTKNEISWAKTPRPVDAAIVYPLDSLKPDEGTECVGDLIRRDAKKICLVTWTDNRDFSWVNQYNPTRVTYDVEAEKPDYHERMKEIEGEGIRHRLPTNLPGYARSANPARLLEIECDQCGCKRWAELNTDYPGKEAIRTAKAGVYEAHCLKCGEVATDNYNWYGRN